MPKFHEVEIDGMMTPVDPEEWAADPDAVIEQVRLNRKAVDLQDHTFDPEQADEVLKHEV